MSKFRSAIVWLVLYTQIWTPVLAQTLPISVDKNAAGQRPFVGTSNGVPVVNIAPPSAAESRTTSSLSSTSVRPAWC